MVQLPRKCDPQHADQKCFPILGETEAARVMHQDDGEPNTKSAAPETWDAVEGKQEGFPPAPGESLECQAV
jgi:hypothetical protein